MKIEERIASLAADVRPVPAGALTRRLLYASFVGGLVSLAAVIALYGLRPDLAEAVAGPSFWTKLLFTAAVTVLAFLAVAHAARPDTRVERRLVLAAVPFVAILVAGSLELLLAEAADRKRLWLGDTWLTCPFSIAALSVPPLVLLIRALRRLAPGSPALAGFSAGLLSGGLAATAYALHCPEPSVAFVATWNVLGILASGLIGALLGPRVLRW
jgi:hypothetical protein